jgi:hypothetical protein
MKRFKSPGFYSKEKDLTSRVSKTDILRRLSKSQGVTTSGGSTNPQTPSNYWILLYGYWDDSGIWVDSAKWVD